MIPSKRQNWLGVLTLAAAALGINDDLFNYGTTFIDENGRNSFPQDEWDAVSCADVEVCVRTLHARPYSSNETTVGLRKQVSFRLLFVGRKQQLSMVSRKR